MSYLSGPCGAGAAAQVPNGLFERGPTFAINSGTEAPGEDPNNVYDTGAFSTTYPASSLSGDPRQSSPDLWGQGDSVSSYVATANASRSLSALVVTHPNVSGAANISRKIAAATAFTSTVVASERVSKSLACLIAGQSSLTATTMVKQKMLQGAVAFLSGASVAVKVARPFVAGSAFQSSFISSSKIAKAFVGSTTFVLGVSATERVSRAFSGSEVFVSSFVATKQNVTRSIKGSPVFQSSVAATKQNISRGVQGNVQGGLSLTGSKQNISRKIVGAMMALQSSLSATKQDVSRKIVAATPGQSAVIAASRISRPIAGSSAFAFGLTGLGSVKRSVGGAVQGHSSLTVPIRVSRGLIFSLVDALSVSGTLSSQSLAKALAAQINFASLVSANVRVQKALRGNIVDISNLSISGRVARSFAGVGAALSQFNATKQSLVRGFAGASLLQSSMGGNTKIAKRLSSSFVGQSNFVTSVGLKRKFAANIPALLSISSGASVLRGVRGNVASSLQTASNASVMRTTKGQVLCASSLASGVSLKRGVSGSVITHLDMLGKFGVTRGFSGSVNALSAFNTSIVIVRYLRAQGALEFTFSSLPFDNQIVIVVDELTGDIINVYYLVEGDADEALAGEPDVFTNLTGFLESMPSGDVDSEQSAMFGDVDDNDFLEGAIIPYTYQIVEVIDEAIVVELQ